MEERNKGLIIFGIVLLGIGLFASFYSEQKYPGAVTPFDLERTYPYQSVGILLDVAGIIFVALGLLLPLPRKTIAPPLADNPPQSS